VSGIAGIIRLCASPVEPALIGKLTGAMVHRGPDGIHHWVKGPVALGHCLLRSTPQPLGKIQPVTNEDESLVLVMDGRLDNRHELRQKLRSGRVRLRNDSDAEYVLAAYELWGDESPRHLLGDFAYALWDARRQILFCARDHLGVKPFYYVSNQEYFAFASEEETLLGMPGVSGEPNAKFVAASLIGSDVGDILTESWLQDIFKLPPGSRLLCGRSALPRIEAYWQLEPMDEIRLGSDRDYEEAFLALLSETVGCRLKSIGNPSLMLSGGIDSASIGGVAHRVLADSPQQKLHTYSLVADENPHCAETQNIRAFIQGHEAEASLHSVQGSPGGVDDAVLQEAAWQQAHPISNHILLPAMMYLTAGQAGHRVMLDGVDGDAVTGTDRLYMSSLLSCGKWRAAWSECRQASANHTFLQDMPPPGIFARSAWRVFAPTTLKSLKTRIWKAGQQNRIGDSVINRDLAQDLRLAELLVEKRELALSIQNQTEQDRHLRAMMPEIPWSMTGFDTVAARYGVEPGHPWADKRIVEFYLRLPLQQKAGQGWTKFLLRRTMSPLLDSQVAWHKGKGHLGFALVRRLMLLSDMQVRSALDLARSSAARYVDFQSLDQLYRRWKKTDDNRDLYRLFSVTSVLLWLERIQQPCRYTKKHNFLTIRSWPEPGPP
jgi:asparagine synthase (glutamine-hydrolysing)